MPRLGYGASSGFLPALYSSAVFFLFLSAVILLSFSEDVLSLNLTINNYGIMNFDNTNQDSTPYLSIVLMLSNYSAGSFCRYCNDNNLTGESHCRYNSTFSGNWSQWESCEPLKLWELGDFYGDNRKERKYVFVQSDGNCTGGCAPEHYANDSIFYDYTGRGLDTTPPDFPPIIHHTGKYTNINSSLYVYWEGAYDRESHYLNFPLTYKVRLLDNNTPITSWFDVGERTGVTINTPYDMIEGDNYSVQVIAINSVNLTINATSSGIFYENEKPILSLYSDHNSSWSNDSQVTFWFNATDGISGVKGFSYKLDSNQNLALDNEVESTGSNGNVSMYLPSGAYYFHIVAVDNAGNPSIQKDYLVKIDSSHPSRPIFNSSIFYSSDKNISWIGSAEPFSGIRDYRIELSPSPSFDFLVASVWTGSNDTFFDLSRLNVTQGNYYIRIKSRNNVGLESVYSSEKDIFVDNVPPTITLLKPINSQVYSQKPYISVNTSENAVCSFRIDGLSYKGNDSYFYPFSYTGGTYHETFLKPLVGKSGSFSVIVRCLDTMGNPAEMPFDISLRSDIYVSDIRVSKSDSYLKSHLNALSDPKYTDDLRQYESNYLEFNMEVVPKISGISDLLVFDLVPNEIDLDELRDTVVLQKSDIDKDLSTIDLKSSPYRKYFFQDFGIEDNGDGTYNVKMKMPKISGKYDLHVKYSDSSTELDKKVPVDVMPLKFSLRYANPSGESGNVTSLNNLLYFDFSNTSFGLASSEKPVYYYFSDKKDSIDYDSVTNQNVGISSLVDSELFYFFTRKMSFNDKDSELFNHNFLLKDSPNFGFSSSFSNYLNMIISSPDILFLSNKSLDSGKYTLFIENKGSIGNQKKISLSTLDKFSVDTEEVKYTRYDSYG